MEDAADTLDNALMATRAADASDRSHDRAQLLNKLGWLRRMLGDWQRAAHSYEEALAISQDRKMLQFSPWPLRDLDQSFYSLAVVYGDMGEDQKALDMADKVRNAAEQL